MENPTKADVLWFQLWIDPTIHSWAFKDGDPTARIGALEMFGTLLLTSLLLRHQGSGTIRLPLNLVSDNQGNVFSLLTNRSKRFPASAILMQIVMLLYEVGTNLLPSHRGRDYNQWADELTHPNPKGFNPRNNLDISPCLKGFLLLRTIIPDWPIFQ